MDVGMRCEPVRDRRMAMERASVLSRETKAKVSVRPRHGACRKVKSRPATHSSQRLLKCFSHEKTTSLTARHTKVTLFSSRFQEKEPRLVVVPRAASAEAETEQFDRVALLKGMADGVVSQVLAGLTTTLSMIPESLAFTFVAGVPPVVGLHAAATMAFFTAIFGSQHGVISGAAGATAVVLAPLCAKFGIEYLFAAVVLSGLIQLVFGALRFGKFIRLVPQPVMMGFVNGLAIVIGVSQLEQFKVATAAGGHAWMSGSQLYVMAGLTALTMAIIKIWPGATKRVPGLCKIPAPLAAILALTASVNIGGIATRTVGDMASIAGSLPSLHLPQIPLTLGTLTAIAPTALAVAMVGLIETLLTQQLVDQITEEGPSSTHVECIAQGIGNVATGFLGGMGGCAMIGQSMINVNAGGRKRLSGLSCAFFLAMSVVAGSAVIERIPLAALVGTMWMLVIDIFDKSTFKRLSKVPKSDSLVVALVTIITVATNLAVAVFAGVVVSSLNFAWKSAQRITSSREVEPNAAYGKPAAVFKLNGPLFFGSVTQFREMFSSQSCKQEKEEVVVLDFMESRVWDSSALEAISDVVITHQSQGKEIHIRHLSRDCQRLLTRAGDLYDVNVIETEANDPDYGVAANYDGDILVSAVTKSAEGGDESDASRMTRAIQRQIAGGRANEDDGIAIEGPTITEELRWAGEATAEEEEPELRWIGEASSPAVSTEEEAKRDKDDAWYSW